LTMLGGLRAARDGGIDDRHRVRLGDTSQLVSLGRSHAAHLQPDRLLGPSVHQRLDHFENYLGVREHGDHGCRPGQHVARLVRGLGTTIFQIEQVVGVAIPRGHRDALIEQAVGHRGSHQANAQQPDADAVAF
jgi:hypothetical protein